MAPQTAVDDLLCQPFDAALGACSELRKYIEDNEDSAELREEFRQHWSSNAPAELRELLSDLMGLAVAEAAPRPALEGGPTSERMDELLKEPFDKALSAFPELRRYIDENEDAAELEVEFRESWGPRAPVGLRDVLAELLGAPGAQKPPDETQASPSEMLGLSEEETLADRLLSWPFDEAEAQFPALRQYIDAHPAGGDVEVALRHSWGEGAPPEMRRILMRLLCEVRLQDRSRL